jgi:phospholipase C
MQRLGKAPAEKARAAVLALATIATCSLWSCSGAAIPATGQMPDGSRSSAPSSSPIKHVVVMIQENRTFNDFFATYPGADGATTGKMEPDSTCHVRHEETIALKESNLVVDPGNLQHDYPGYHTAYDGGKMDGFDAIALGNQVECTEPYQYTNPAQIKPYWDLAKQYVLAEHMFTTQGSGSFTAHQDLIRGSTQIDATESLVDFPLEGPWGCDAPTGTTTSLITKDDVYESYAGPFPCTTDFPSSYNYDTLRDLLDAKHVSWKYYVPSIDTAWGGWMNAFDLVAPVRYGPEWTTNVITPQTKIFSDISRGKLPAVSWLVPDRNDSDHPQGPVDRGPSWVASVVNAIGTSSYWKSTAIVVVWDDWGGFYDNLAPKQMGFGGLGFRVPALIVSAYAKPGYLSTTDYEFGSILKYIEHNWDLGSLGTTDVRAKSIIDSFDYSQAPIKFVPIKSKYSEEYFIHEKPSYLPVDDDL